MLLANGDFSGGTHPHVEWGWPMHSTQIPDSWELWWHGKTPDDGKGYWDLIEASVIRSGENSHPYPIWNPSTMWATHMYILQQRVIVPRGTILTAEVLCWPWSSGGDVWSDGDPGGSYFTNLAIDPLGRRVEFDTPGVKWAYEYPGLKAHSMELKHTVTATAEVDAVTVCCFGFAEWRMKNNRCPWYRASLVVQGENPPQQDIEQRVQALEGWRRSMTRHLKDMLDASAE